MSDYPKDVRKLMIDSISNPPAPEDFIPMEQLAAIGTQINSLLSNQKFRSYATYGSLKPLPNPAMKLISEAKDGKYDDMSDEEWEEAKALAEEESVVWNKKQFISLGISEEYACLEQELGAAARSIRNILEYMIANEHSYEKLAEKLAEKRQEEKPSATPDI